MAYNKINWEAGEVATEGYVIVGGETYQTVQPEYTGNTPINPDNLNHMDNGIKTANDFIDGVDDYVIDTGTATAGGTTWTYTKWNSGKVDLYGSGSKTGMTIATASAGTYYGANAKLELTLPFALSSVLYIGVQETAPRSSGVWAYASTISGTTLTTEFRSFGAINNNGSCGCSYHIVGTIL